MGLLDPERQTGNQKKAVVITVAATPILRKMNMTNWKNIKGNVGGKENSVAGGDQVTGGCDSQTGRVASEDFT